MIFHELYGCYYQAVAEMIRLAQKDELTRSEMKEICDSIAFPESYFEIIPAIRQQRWQLIEQDYSTPVIHDPSLPLTLLEKRWLKAVSLDPRFRLFNIPLPELDEVEPLFTPDDCVVFDRYLDGDPFEDPTYIRNFRTVLKAVKEHRNLRVRYINRHGREFSFDCIPQAIEYSEKDDKFRVILSSERIRAINIQRIVSCEVTDRCRAKYPLYATEQRTVKFDVLDERNTLERVLLHFAHFEKQAEKTDDKHYRVTLKYDPTDETEVLIRILSFGPMIRVTGPGSFVELIRSRLVYQAECLEE